MVGRPGRTVLGVSPKTVKGVRNIRLWNPQMGSR